MQGKLLLDQIKDIFQEKDYTFYDGRRPYNLNIIGIRNIGKVGRFNDLLAVVYRDEHLMWKINLMPCTTESGIPWLLRPLHKDGTAIILEGQFKGAYKKGIHGRSRPSGGYPALEQVKPMLYVRDNNRDDKLDFTGVPFSGILKTNIHRAYSNRVAEAIGKYSAGCCVVQNPNDFAFLMDLCDRSINSGLPNSFTFTLINQTDLSYA